MSAYPCCARASFTREAEKLGRSTPSCLTLLDVCLAVRDSSDAQAGFKRIGKGPVNGSAGQEGVAQSVQACTRHIASCSAGKALRRSIVPQARAGVPWRDLGSPSPPLPEWVVRQASLKLVPDLAQTRNRSTIFQPRVPEYHCVKDAGKTVRLHRVTKKE